MRFSYYGGEWRAGITLPELVKHNAERRDLWARAEFSGCEGCFCEVARWNPKTERWERFASAKCFGGEHPSEKDREGVHAHETAEKFAQEINDAGSCGNHAHIHGFPNWRGD